MYVQITTRCNMTCAHCCYNCTQDGIDMSIEIYRKAVNLCESFGESIAIGGGEPTIHPSFLEFLTIAIAADLEYVWLATNGSMTEYSLMLAKMAKTGLIGVALSQDPFHDPIAPEVVRAFTHSKQRQYGTESNNDSREIRNTSNSLSISGRCEEGEDICCCPDFFIQPDGNIRYCGCEDSPTIGNVHDGIPEEIYEEHRDCNCHKDRLAKSA